MVPDDISRDSPQKSQVQNEKFENSSSDSLHYDDKTCVSPFLVRHKIVKNLSNLLNANRIYQNISTTEVVLFKSARRHIDVPLKCNGKRLHPTNSVKYFRIKIDELVWK